MSRIEQIAAEFKEMTPSERLELLLEYSDTLPTVPDRYQTTQELESHRVPECQTPVSLWVEVIDGKVYIYADVPQESPTVRGFIAMLIDAFQGATTQEVLEAPFDILIRSGLAETIGMRRLIGLEAVFHHLKQVVADNPAPM